MTNPQRGEVTIKGPGGKDYNLCLTLGAIAQIEDQLDVDSLMDMEEVFDKPSMNHLLIILIALLHGGGHTDIKKEDMIAWDIRLKDLMAKIQEVFIASGFNDGEEEEEEGN